MLLNHCQQVKAQRDDLQVGYDKAVRQTDSLQQDVIVYRSMLKDDGRNVDIPLEERHGRIWLDQLEKGRVPRVTTDQKKIFALLESNEKQGFIPSHRLKAPLQALKQLIQKAVEFSMEAVRSFAADQKQSKTQKSRSRDDGRSL